MKHKASLIVCMVSAIKLVFGEVWEFGENIPTSIIISHIQGDISLLDKSKRIQLHVPDCHEIDYVRVEVDNMVSNPAVYYNKLTQTVTISYKPLQISMSTYDIVAKAKMKDSCTTHSDTVKLVYG